jgi:CRISPR/Cas system-associated exonuclease Cas4 (RecB family)
MTSDDDRFETAIVGSNGLWPGPPDLWSYSSLREGEECPRRWMLSRASYPELWNHAGYPQRPNLASIAGSVVHDALELLLREFQTRRCASIQNAAAVDVIRDLGGYSRIVETQIDRALKRLEGNPRGEPLLRWLRRNLVSRVPELRQTLQALISRSTLSAVAHVGEDDIAEESGPLGPGSHAEIGLIASELRFQGRADLLTIDAASCVVTDYKTGTPDPKHADQVRTYAVLWDQDHRRNPANLPVSRLVIAYPDHDEVLDGPSPSELREIAENLATRVADTERLVTTKPPPARPSAAVCEFCGVRQMCEDYWDTPEACEPVVGEQTRPVFADREGVIVGRNGPKSWVLAERRTEATTLLRTLTNDAPFTTGDRVRILHAVRTPAEDTSGFILSLTQASEVFVLRKC